MDDSAIFAAMFQHATTGVLIVNPQGVIIKANPYLEKIFGYQNGELIGEQMEILLPQPLREKHERHRAHFFQAPMPRSMGDGLTLYGRRKDGSRFPVEISLGYTKVAEVDLAIGFVNDISARKKAEQGWQKEKELNELKSRFVSMASHEFRTPLTTIQASAELVDMYIDRNKPDKQRRQLRRITSSVKNLTSILNDFLSLEKLESQKVEVRPAWLELESFVKDFLEEVLLLARPDQDICFTHCGENKFCIDEHLLRNILMNLLSNAIKYSVNGENVFLRTEVDSGVLRIKVEDRGIGIPLEEQGELFTRFFRATNANTIKGTGLGLTIVKRYLDLMGGNISFVSEEGSGTTFLVEIPATLPPPVIP